MKQHNQQSNTDINISVFREQKSVQKLKLKRNLRVQLHLQGDVSAGESLNKLLNIGFISLQTATSNSFLTFVTEVRGSSLECSTDCPN
jgi:hypothetical protein